MAVFRAIENRRSLIRAANTGISGFIDPAGRLLSQTGLFEEAVMTYSVPVIKKYTSIYTGYGNLLVLGCFIILAFIIMIKLAGQLVRKKVAERK
jgi:apolipoprotein N-acyltransferase